jgi:hypothetical protein
MIHGSSCEANLPLIAALPDTIATDLELYYYKKMYLYSKFSKQRFCVIDNLSLLEQPDTKRTVTRTGKDVRVYLVVCLALPSLSALQ